MAMARRNKQFTPNLHWCYNTRVKGFRLPRTCIRCDTFFVCVCVCFGYEFLFALVRCIRVLFSNTFFQWLSILFLQTPCCRRPRLIGCRLSRAKISMYRKKHQKFSSFFLFDFSVQPFAIHSIFFSFSVFSTAGAHQTRAHMKFNEISPNQKEETKAKANERSSKW